MSAARENELHLVNFRKTALSIGIELDGNAPWMEFSADDLQVLYTLLTKKIGDVAAIDESDMLRMLASWCAQACRAAREVEAEKEAESIRRSLTTVRM
jgi:hypothetical protein